MFPVVAGVLGIVATWVILSVVFIGLGLAAESYLIKSGSPRGTLFGSFWIGFAAVIPALLAWHLFFRISGVTIALRMSAGAAGIVRHLHVIRTWPTPSKSSLAVLAVVTLWAANHAAGSPNAYDSAMYQMQSVRWANTYPVVPGLGNLHDRLAFNTASTLYFAMLNVGPLAGLAAHIGTGLLVVMLFGELLIARLGAQRQASITPCEVFDLTLMVALCSVTVAGMTSTLLTDAPVAVVMLVVGRRVFRMLADPPIEPLRRGRDISFVVLMASIAVCLKPSSLIAAPFFAVAGALGTGRFREAWRALPKRISAAVFLIAAVWLCHSIVLSGYPLFPSPVFRVAAPWSVPAELAQAESAWITRYARHSDATGFGWIRRWFFVERYAAIALSDGILCMWIPLSIVLISGVGVAAWWKYRNRARRLNWAGWWVLAPTSCGLVAWFVLAPAPRFALALFWLAAATCAAQTLPQWTKRSVVCVSVLVGAAVVTFLAHDSEPWAYRRWESAVVGDVFERYRAGSPFAQITAPSLTTFTTASGLSLWVPRTGALCYDAPLPCTPHPAQNLAQYTAIDGRPMFVTNGDWQQSNWPNASRVDFSKRFMKAQ